MHIVNSADISDAIQSVRVSKFSEASPVTRPGIGREYWIRSAKIRNLSRESGTDGHESRKEAWFGMSKTAR